MSGGGTDEHVLDNFLTSLETTCEQLRGDTPSRPCENFDEGEFWNNLTGATKLLSHEATKFCMMFCKKPLPLPTACKSIVESLENKCLTLLMVFFSFPKSKGKTLHRDLQIFILTILQAIRELCRDAKQNSSNQLQLAGNVWAKCEVVEKLPRDNKTAVISIFQDQLATVQDALQEIQENMNSVNEEELDELLVASPNGLSATDHRWSDADHQLLPSCVGLIKAVKACLKKIKTLISNLGHEENAAVLAQLDELSEICKLSSSLVDDFVLSLYPPMNHSVVKDQASSVVAHLRKLLSTAHGSQFCTPADEEWITFLRTAVTHNWEKITDRVLED